MSIKIFVRKWFKSCPGVLSTLWNRFVGAQDLGRSRSRGPWRQISWKVGPLLICTICFKHRQTKNTFQNYTARLFDNYYYGGKIKDGEAGLTCSTHGRQERHTQFWPGKKMKGRNHLQDLEADGKIMQWVPRASRSEGYKLWDGREGRTQRYVPVQRSPNCGARPLGGCWPSEGEQVVCVRDIYFQRHIEAK
jgi:hypothetical protein